MLIAEIKYFTIWLNVKPSLNSGVESIIFLRKIAELVAELSILFVLYFGNVVYFVYAFSHELL